MGRIVQASRKESPRYPAQYCSRIAPERVRKVRLFPLAPLAFTVLGSSNLGATPTAVSYTHLFPKERVLTFKRYADRRDLLSVLLEDGKEYTHDQIDGLIKDFMKGKVN